MDVCNLTDGSCKRLGLTDPLGLGAFRAYLVVLRVGSEAVGGGGGPRLSRSST